MRTPEERACHREMIGLLHDGCIWCPKREISRDIKSFTRRFQHEGFGFLAKILPALGKALDRALSGNENLVVPSHFKCGKDTAAPKLLGYAFSLIFNKDGSLKQDVPADLISWIRTFCFYCYKVEVPFEKEQIEEFSEAFIQTDRGLPRDFASIPLTRLMAHQLSDLLGDPFVGRPKYGPGISSDFPRFDRYRHYVPPSRLRQELGRDFFHQPSEFFELEVALLFLYGFLLGFKVSSDLCIDYTLHEEGYTTSKVLFVPKDSRGPRVICCEPAYKMKAQQAIRQSLYSVVESHPRSRGRVNFSDQSVNQKLTYSYDRLATLDLKEASDRVSLALVREVFPPNWVKLFELTRSPLAILPDGRTVKQKKFAPMGNALCFPVMALVAYTCVLSGIYLAGGPLPKDNNSVFVYGDDIIVPNEYALIAMSCLEEVGLLVNRSKSYINSQFLESCGQDTFRGESVNCIKRRKMPMQTRNVHVRPRRITTEVDNIAHGVALANELAAKGHKNASKAVFSNVEDVCGPLPYGTTESPYLCKVVDTTEIAWELNGHVQEGEMEIRAYVIKDGSLNVKHSEWSRLRSNLIDGGGVSPDLFGGIPPFDPMKIGKRSPVLLRTTLKQWYVGSYTVA